MCASPFACALHPRWCVPAALPPGQAEVAALQQSLGVVSVSLASATDAASQAQAEVDSLRQELEALRAAAAADQAALAEAASQQAALQEVRCNLWGGVV